MTDEHPKMPEQVRKRDGRVVPFDAGKISQALFAATEALGRPDAFLARELTDGVLHFLAAENDEQTLTTAQIAETVTKTVRELGQPALAEAFANRRKPPADESEGAIILRAPRDIPPPHFVPQLLRDYTRQAVYTSQLIAAQSDGLLTIAGLDAPGEFAAAVVGPGDNLEDVRRWVSGTVVFDGPEFAHVHDVEPFVRETLPAARLLGLRAVVNLNCAAPPPWAGDLARGPLFDRHEAADEAAMYAAAGRWLERVGQSSPGVHLNWHVAERDCAEGRLSSVARVAAQGGAITFHFDRPRRPVNLADGIDRQHSAVLLTVGLHLPRLAEQAGLTDNVNLLLHKLGSLARLAVSAGVQKREYLRRLERAHPSPLTTGFLLDRARLVVAPVGLDHVVRRMLGRGLTSGGAALDLGKQIVTRLRDVLKQEARTTHLDACVDGPSDFGLAGPPSDGAGVAGLTAWDANAATKNQERAGGALHAVVDRGTMALFLRREELTPETIAECLRQAWENSDVAGVRVCVAESAMP
jgi:hypothetical protein